MWSQKILGSGSLHAARPLAHSPSASAPPWSLYTLRQRWGFLAVLFLVSTSNFIDRNIIAVLLEPIKQEFKLSDTALGLFGGFCFSLFYAVAGMPVARWADRGDRRTVIAIALTVWSVMTVFCGLAQTFWQLALARLGVGVGESGAIPPAHSLIADYFPPKQRATALAVFTASATAGYLLGFGVGGHMAATYGWRSAFLLAGVPGLALALVVRFTLDEPRLHLNLSGASTQPESVGETILRLRRKRSVLYALSGCLLYWLFGYGGLIFIPSYLMRVLHSSLTEVSVTYGAVVAVGSLIGTLGGGWLADRLSRRDIRWLAWFPAVAVTLTGPIFMTALWFDHFAGFLALAFVAWLLLSCALPPIFAAIHAVCGNRRRATAIAIVLFSATLFGGGFGPLATGALSDALKGLYGTEGLRYSLMAIMVLPVASGGAFYWLGRAMPSDLED